MGHLDDLEELVRTSPVLSRYPEALDGPGGHQNKFVAVLEGPVTVLCKPPSGFNDGGLVCPHEVAAWKIARLLGWTDLVATTVLRPMVPLDNGPEEEMSLQVLWPRGELAADIEIFSESERVRAALFDYLVAQGDRVTNNWLAIPRLAAIGDQRWLKLVDHGLAFNHPARPNTESVFVERYHRHVLDADLLADLSRLSDGIPASGLAALLKHPSSFDSFVARLNEVLASGVLP